MESSPSGNNKCLALVIEPNRDRRKDPVLRLAIIFLIISLIAGALGLVNISTVARRISMVLFALFFLLAALLFGMVVLIGEAIVN
jgi:uncharacterized membrane protein YtjA (UPF0391 family)